MKKIFTLAIVALAAISLNAQLQIKEILIWNGDAITYHKDLDDIDSITFATRTIQVPTGAIAGKYTINAKGDQVVFSKGNLQSQPGNKHFRFAENQWETISQADNERIAPYGDYWIDLFNWGTGANPGDTTSNYEECQYEFHDWGANRIINGGDSANLWRTLTEKEWKYILMSRPHASERFSLGTVNGVKGLILLPDYWELPAGHSFNVPNMTAEGQDYYREYGKNIDHFIDNTYTATQWQAMETNGAVFLPVTGYRLGTEVTLEDICYYWTSGVPESSENLYAYRVRAFSKWIQGAQGTQRIFGCAVRLARDL